MISKKNVPENRASGNPKTAQAEIRKARERKKKNLDFSTFAG